MKTTTPVNTLRSGIRLLLVGLSLLFCHSLYALSSNTLPTPLQSWQAWALYGTPKNTTCPMRYDSAKQRYCTWNSHLTLDTTHKGARFSLTARVFRPSWVTLPGSSTLWPQDVHNKTHAVPVLLHNKSPSVYLPTGTYTLTGRFAWHNLPEVMPIPKNTALITLSLQGKAIPFPDINARGLLRLAHHTQSNALNDKRLSIQVFRKLESGVPLTITTLIKLEATGPQRTLTFSRVLLSGAHPLQINSALPVHLDKNGRLQVKLRHGRWTIRLRSRFTNRVTTLTPPRLKAPWPSQETWVLAADNRLGLTQLSGALIAKLDKESLPKDWHRYSAYIVDSGQTVELKTLGTEGASPTANDLSLQRHIWLDLDGQGYTVIDQIHGKMHHGWRLQAAPALPLGRISVGEHARLITQLEGSKSRGIEIREGDLETHQVHAISHVTHPPKTLLVTDWLQDFHSVRTILELPPGWSLFSTSGIDTVNYSWLSFWSLLDVFLVLIISLAVSRVLGKSWGLLALITLLLTYQRAKLVAVLWLNLLCAIALYRVLPIGRLKHCVAFYRKMSFVALIACSVPFFVQQLRLFSSPQAIQRDLLVGGDSTYVSPYETDDFIYQPQLRKREKIKLLFSSTTSHTKTGAQTNKDTTFSSIQTGPAVPRWHWRNITLQWDGLVRTDQHFTLYLIPPWLNRLLAFLGVVCSLGLLLGFAGLRYRRGQGFHFEKSHFASLAALILPCLLLASLTLPQTAQADIPSKALLKTLRERLLTPPACLPHCANIGALRLTADPTHLTLRMQINSATDAVLPLPAQRGVWWPTQITLDGAMATVQRSKAGTLLMHVSQGVHDVRLSGPIKASSELLLPFAVKPHFIEANAQGWLVTGISRHQLSGQALQLTRTQPTKAAARHNAFAPSRFPPFVRVERTITLGLDWSIETRVQRLAPQQGVIDLDIPLLKGESVLQNVSTHNHHATVHLNADQQSLTWHSVLKRNAALSLTLSAPPTTVAWVELWRLVIDPRWHSSIQGPAAIHAAQNETIRSPFWMPWPGQTLRVSLSQPPAVPGPSMTIDLTELSLRPGAHDTLANLLLHVRSSAGGQHAITLPRGAKLQSLELDKQQFPISRTPSRQVSFPLRPGKTVVKVGWRVPQGISWKTTTPVVDLKAPSYNNQISVHMPYKRWVLFIGGPRLGPALQFWGMLLFVIILSIGLARSTLTPLNATSWLLLGIGMSTISPLSFLLVVVWLFMLGLRAKVPDIHNVRFFRFKQLSLVMLTGAAFICLFLAVSRGLLATPDMQIVNHLPDYVNTYATTSFRWYQNFSQGNYPNAWIISAPLWIYRLAMLVWSLWLSIALLNWINWGWQCFCSGGGYWHTPEEKNGQ